MIGYFACVDVFTTLCMKKKSSKEITIKQKEKKKKQSESKTTFGNTVVNQMQKKQFLSCLEFLRFIPL